VLAFSVHAHGRPDYWQYLGPDGRKRALAWADPATGQPGPRIELDKLPAQACPHYIIALDGVPFELVEELYRQGRFRLFFPPARVICGYPSMTDLALNELFHAGRSLGYQAKYFDRSQNRISDGNASYLSAANSPWVRKMGYRCSFWWDVLVYLAPQPVFNHEFARIADTFRRSDTNDTCAYSVGTAGLGTRHGAAAMRAYLQAIDDFCERIVFERRGRVKLTLTADHGHNLVENRLVSFDDWLRAGGYRPRGRIDDPRDVVTISYGLVTYAEFHTRDPAGVARRLAAHPDVEFACYAEADALVVLNPTGQARLTRGPRGFRYDSQKGDPLGLRPVLERLAAEGKISPDGQIDPTALFEATVDHEYPDPLDRLWGAFHELVENPPDVIANLRDGVCHGSRFFHTMIGRVASTHGSLNRRNSTTFALTMLGELPPALRSRDLLPALEKLRLANPIGGRTADAAPRP